MVMTVHRNQQDQRLQTHWVKVAIPDLRMITAPRFCWFLGYSTICLSAEGASLFTTDKRPCSNWIGQIMTMPSSKTSWGKQTLLFVLHAFFFQSCILMKPEESYTPSPSQSRPYLLPFLVNEFVVVICFSSFLFAADPLRFYQCLNEAVCPGGGPDMWANLCQQEHICTAKSAFPLSNNDFLAIAPCSVSSIDVLMMLVVCRTPHE